MANIRVKCPACKSELEIGAEHAGQEVECGNCLEVFKAKVPGGNASSSDTGLPPRTALPSGSGRGKPARKPRRDDDDDDYESDRRRPYEDDDYDDYAPPYRRSDGAGDGAATASLVLGIIALVLVCCWPLSLPLGLAATITGGLGLKSRNNKGMAVAGLVLGILSLCAAGMFLLFFAANAAQGR